MHFSREGLKFLTMLLNYKLCYLSRILLKKFVTRVSHLQQWYFRYNHNILALTTDNGRNMIAVKYPIGEPSVDKYLPKSTLRDNDKKLLLFSRDRGGRGSKRLNLVTTWWSRRGRQTSIPKDFMTTSSVTQLCHVKTLRTQMENQVYGSFIRIWLSVRKENTI